MTTPSAQEEIQRFISQLIPKVESPGILTDFAKDIDEAKAAVWPETRRGQFGLQLLPVSYVTNKDEQGVGYYFEFEIQLDDPEETHFLIWFLPVDPSRDVIVGHLKGDEIKTWTRYAPPGQEQKLH